MEIRRLLAQKLERGKVDFSLWVEKESTVDATPINAALIENYYKQIKAISASTGIPEPEDWFTTLLRLPDVTAKTEVEVLDDEEWEVAQQANQCKLLKSSPNSANRKELLYKRSLLRRLTISLTS